MVLKHAKLLLINKKCVILQKKSGMKKVILVLLFSWLGNYIFSQTYLLLKDRYFSLSEEGTDYYNKNLCSSFDLTDSEYWPPVYQQTDWVCNQVAASYYMMSYETNLKKDISSHVIQNLFSVYFPWNFGNGGHGWYGDHYIITMEMMRDFGVPHLTQSPADIVADSAMWMSGYDLYYEAMHNKIEDYYGIKVNTASGITTLKSWIYDHGGGEPGGTATFLANIAENGDAHFAAGTPESGAYVITRCGNDALHARTIVGFNDDVCYDYNNDGQYTNDIDINADGVVDVRDWEKGGFKVAESFGPTWQGEGYCWIMYKAMADEYGNGGILNNDVHVIIPKTEYEPLLTVKFEIKHSSREKIKIKVGISSDPDADTYEYVKEFPVFNYQGGNKYMKGGLTEEDKTLEAGLDITSLLEYFNEESCAKIFLIVEEYDNNDVFEGHINHFSVIDYSGSSAHEFTGAADIDIINNSTTIIPVNVCANQLNVPVITTQSLPVLSAGVSNWIQLEYNGGTPPYTWEILPFYEQNKTTATYEYITDNKLTPNSYFDGALQLELPFFFPFDGELTNQIKIHTNGYILPFSSTNPWTQFREHMYPFFINEKVISPLLRFNLVSDYDENDGIWYAITQDTVKIRWHSSDQWAEPWTRVDFGCNLVSNGDVEFCYGETYLKNMYSNIGGVSFGHLNDNVICWNDNVPSKDTKITVRSYPVPEGLKILSSGVIYGEPGNYENYPFRVRITDANGISHTVNYELTTVVGEESYNDSDVVEIYPNPVLFQAGVKINSDSIHLVETEIYDFAGKLMRKNKIYTNIEVMTDFSDLKPGGYIIVVYLNGERITRNFVKI